MPAHPLKELNLDRPLVFFDLETTGLSMLDDRIVQLAYIKYLPGSSKPEKATFVFNPEIPISPSASAVHGFKDSDVRSAPLFRTHAKELFDVFNDCFFGGFNIIGFDLPLLRQEFLRAGEQFNYKGEDIIDAKVVYHFFESRTLTDAYRYYCDKEYMEAHDALADTSAAAEILFEQIKRYGVEGVQKARQDKMIDYVDRDCRFYWRDGEIVFAFSKHRNRPLAQVAAQEPGFLEWMLSQDFSDEVKEIITEALAGKLRSKK